MRSAFNSASKFVFIIIAITVCAGFAWGMLEAKDFMVLASMAFAFYFSFKGDNNQTFAGK